MQATLMLNRRSLLTAAAATAALPASAWARPGVDLNSLILQERVPALGYAVVSSTAVKKIEVAGRRRLDRPDPVKADDAWHIGDNTMGLTAAVYARLVEAGKSSWGTKLSAIFPDVKLDAAFADATVETLLAHRSGLEDVAVTTPDWLARGHADTRTGRAQRKEEAAALLTSPPTSKPGDFILARANYVVAGAALEAIAAADYEDLAKSEAFDWWGATSAGFGPPLGDAPWGHSHSATGMFEPVAPGEFADYPRSMTAATGAHLSLAEYARFVQLILSDGGGWLKPASLARLARPYDHATSGYGLGWRFIEEQGWAKGPVLTHQGSNTLWRTHVVIAPARDLAVISVCNADAESACQRTIQLALKSFGEEAPAFNELKL